MTKNKRVEINGNISAEKGKVNNNNNSEDRKEWSKEWALEKQTEGLDPKAVAKQHKIAEEMKKEAKKEDQITEKKKL